MSSILIASFSEEQEAGEHVLMNPHNFLSETFQKCYHLLLTEARMRPGGHITRSATNTEIVGKQRPKKQSQPTA